MSVSTIKKPHLVPVMKVIDIAALIQDGYFWRKKSTNYHMSISLADIVPELNTVVFAQVYGWWTNDQIKDVPFIGIDYPNLQIVTPTSYDKGTIRAMFLGY